MRTLEVLLTLLALAGGAPAGFFADAPGKKEPAKEKKADAPKATSPAPADCCVLVRKQEHAATSCGSGTCVSCDKDVCLILTNRHVVGTSGPCSVEHKGRTYAAWVCAYASRCDLACLIVHGASIPAAEVAPADPLAGADCSQFGHPFGGPQKRKLGRVLADTFREVTGGMGFRSTVVSESGDSGAALFVGGKVVGVTAWGGPGGQASAGHVSLAEVKSFLRFACDNLKPEDKPKVTALAKTLGPEPKEAPKATAPMFGGSCPSGTCPTCPARPGMFR